MAAEKTSRLAAINGASLEELARARDEVRSSRSDPTGTLRVTASVAFGQTCMVPLMSAFRRAYPRLSLELLMTDANLDLIEDRIDIAVRLGPSRRADVQAEKLFDTRYRVCASPRYVDKNGAPKRPNDLRERDCVLMALTAFRSRWLFRMKGTVEEIPVAGNLVFSTALAVRSATVDSLGPALLPDWLIGGDLRSGSLVDLFPDYDVTATTFETAAWMLYPSADYIPKRVQATMDFLRREVQP
jgi:DNA-binding transcriptional LysR family regulator